MASTKVPAIYRIPSKVDPELKNYLESVQEAIEIRLGRRGDELDRAITLRELISSGLASDLKSSPFNPNNPEVQTFQPKIIYDGTIPPLPTGFSAGAGFRTITLDWDMPPMANFSYTEIWRSEDSFIDNAVRVDTTIAFVWSDTVAYASTYYYWVNFVSTSGIVGPKAGPKSATTAADIGAVMSALSEEISVLPGFTALNSTITAKTEVIKATSAPGTRSGGSALQASDIWIDTDDNNQAYVRNSRVSAESNLATASSVTTVSAAVAAKTDVYRASSAPSGGTYVAGDLWIDTDDNQMYQWNGSAWASARDSGLATASALSVVEASATTANNLAGTKVKTFRQNGIPTSLAIGDMWFDTNDSNKMYIAEAVGADAVTSGEWVLAADAIVNSAGASITALSTAITNLQGDADASYVLQVNANGAVAGMVIESTAQGSSSSSSIAFQADQFSIWDGSGATSSSGNRTAPFIVDSGTVYIVSAMIQDAAITNAKIANATIESAKIITLEAAKIANLSATKIAAGSIETVAITIGASTGARVELDGGNSRIVVIDNSA